MVLESKDMSQNVEKVSGLQNMMRRGMMSRKRLLTGNISGSKYDASCRRTRDGSCEAGGNRFGIGDGQLFCRVDVDERAGAWAEGEERFCKAVEANDGSATGGVRRRNDTRRGKWSRRHCLLWQRKILMKLLNENSVSRERMISAYLSFGYWSKGVMVVENEGDYGCSYTLSYGWSSQPRTGGLQIGEGR